MLPRPPPPASAGETTSGLAEGAFGDLGVVPGDPRADITEMGRVTAVVAEGRLVRRD